MACNAKHLALLAKLAPLGSLDGLRSPFSARTAAHRQQCWTKKLLSGSSPPAL